MITKMCAGIYNEKRCIHKTMHYNSIKHMKKYIFPNSTLLFSLIKTALFKKSMGFLNKAKYYIHI